MRITVFTPTYNRAYIIENLYRSLQAQTFHDFEWLVIDDGSADNTKVLFDSWVEDGNAFPIRYYYENNKGKMKEINRALDLARGDLFFTVDSDDVLTKDALEKIHEWETTIPKDGKYCGLAGNCGYTCTESHNPQLPGNYYDASLFQRYRNEKGEWIGADRAWVFYTDIYQKYKFPEFENEKFIAEAVSWNRMAQDKLKIRCFNDIIYLFQHQESGYTASMSQTLIKSPKGYGLWKAELMEFQKYSFIQRIREYYIYYCDLVGNHSWREIAEYIHAPVYIMFMIHMIYKIKHGG